MSRYAAMFERLGEEGAFGAFVTLGDPDLHASAAVLDALVAGGADIIEVGIPFSDPVMDGPVIQEASQRALHAGTTPAGILEELTKLDAGIPVATSVGGAADAFAWRDDGVRMIGVSDLGLVGAVAADTLRALRDGV